VCLDLGIFKAFWRGHGMGWDDTLFYFILNGGMESGHGGWLVAFASVPYLL